MITWLLRPLFYMILLELIMIASATALTRGISNCNCFSS